MRRWRATLAGSLAAAACAPGTVFDLGVGDCFDHDADRGSEVVDIATVSCDEPHDNEVFHTFEVEGDEDFPGLAALEATAAERCSGAAFEEHVGHTYERSEVEVYPITPTADSWEQADDRVVACVAHIPGERIEGTLRDTGR